MENSMSKAEWQSVLETSENALGFTLGFKPLYCPWETLHTAKVAFLSLNPGRAPNNAELRLTSDERGNSYEVEKYTTRSPLTAQFLLLCDLLGLRPSEVLTGVAAPFRSNNWQELTLQQRKGSLEIGRRFWEQPLSCSGLQMVITCSTEATKLAVSITAARPDTEVSAAWGKIRLRRFVSESGKVVIQLPHLSRFRLLGRPASEAAILSLI